MIKKLFTLFVLLGMSTSLIYAQGQTFARTSLIDPPATFGSGFGATVSGVDLDGDGKVEIYSVNGMSDYMNGDEYPQIIKYENNGGSWDSVWAVSFPDERQNTWAALTTGDLDGDGKMEIIWGYVNSFSENVSPPRIVVFETSGDDMHGVDDGNGGFLPNTTWDMDLAESTNMRPLKWATFDIDGDTKEEVVFAVRSGEFNLGVISVDNVPDAGDGSETWTMEFNATTELYNQFVRSAQVVPSELDFPGGVGDILSGVDIDKDGLMDAYFINDNTNDASDDELRPKMVKAELVNGAWIPRWEIDLGDMIPLQNTWPILKHADWDGDGKEEVVWLIVNNTSGDDKNPTRIVVFEAAGDTTDAMGISDGMGSYTPNAMWNFDVVDDANMRPLNAEFFDIDSDGKEELLFAERTDYYLWGIVDVDDIPDAGDGSETWTLEAAGTGAQTGGSVYSDMAVANGNMYVLDWNGDITKISWDGSAYVSSVIQSGVPLWSFKSMQGVDIDDDGTEEILVADYNSGGKIYVLTEDADTLAVNELADPTTIGIPRMPGGNIGDIDNDGMVDFIVGARGSDIIGRLEYQGGSITDPASYALTVLDSGAAPSPGIGNYEVIHCFNIDDDPSDEVFYTSAYQRDLATGETYSVVVGHYSDTLTAEAGNRWDMVIANNAAHFFDGDGDIQSLYYMDGSYKLSINQPTVVNGAFLSASAYDVEGDGIEEIFVGNWYDAKVSMLKWTFGYWTPTEIYDFTDVGGARMNGGAIGDLDNDGFVDFITGSRGSIPNGQIYRVEFMGGDPMEPMNWRGEVIDELLNETHTQYEVVNLANLDDDEELEVLYTSDYARGPNTGDDPQVPLVILDVTTIESELIAAVKVDDNADYIPDRLGEEVTIQGVVTTNSYSGSAMYIFVQDESAGISVYQGGNDSLRYEIGTLLLVTGTVGQFNGLTQIEDPSFITLGVGTVPEAMDVTLQYLAENSEALEGSLIRIKGLVKAEGSSWPNPGSNGTLMLTDGYEMLAAFLDRDTGIPDSAEVTYPINISGIAAQYSTASPANDGYQIMPRSYDDFEQNVRVLPNANFALLSPADGAVVSITDSSDTFEITWEDAIDLNDDPILYQWFVLGDALVSGPLSSPMYTLDAETVLGAMAGADSLTVQWSVRAKGQEQDFVASVDTFTVTFVNDVPVGVESNIPNEFFVDQNYPNPFNPTTTIKFGMPSEGVVDLRIYDILGREVVTLINNESRKAGTYTFMFNASNLASGTYIYRLTTDNHVVTKKMLLLK